MEEIKKGQAAESERKESTGMPDKGDYIRRIMELSAEDQAFLDGYLFAKVTGKPA